jgi:hypothetical protein
LHIVGDFQQVQLDGWIDKYLGAIKKPSDSIARVTEVEPEWTTERRFEKFGPNVPFPADRDRVSSAEDDESGYPCNPTCSVDTRRR